jgi:hypothetical protein
VANRTASTVRRAAIEGGGLVAAEGVVWGGGQAFWRDAARFAAMSVVRLISRIVSGSIGTVPCGLLGVDLDGGSVEWR